MTRKATQATATAVSETPVEQAIRIWAVETPVDAVALFHAAGVEAGTIDPADLTLNLIVEAGEPDVAATESAPEQTSEGWTDDCLRLRYSDPESQPETGHELSAAVSVHAHRIQRRTFDVLFAHLRETMAVVPEGMTPGDVARGINMECLRVANDMARRTYIANGYHKCVAPFCEALASPFYAACPKHGIRFSR